MTKHFEVKVGIDFPPMQRREIGDTVTDEELPKESIPWLVEGGYIVPTKAPKQPKEDAK